jgi:hypothetical protein
MSRNALVLTAFAAVWLSACSPTPTVALLPTFDAQAAARTLASNSLSNLLNGESTTPTLIDWATIEANAPLPPRQTSALCETLESPLAEKVMAGLVSAGFNALSFKLRHKPLSEETRTIVDLAATFAIKTCPHWFPGQVPKATAISLAWYPLGYQPLVADANVAWTWVDPATCSTPGPCWNVNIVARTGCPSSVSIVVAAYDSDGVVVDLGAADLGPSLPNSQVGVEIVSDAPSAKTATVDYISCS